MIITALVCHIIKKYPMMDKKKSYYRKVRASLLLSKKIKPVVCTIQWCYPVAVAAAAAVTVTMPVAVPVAEQ